MTGNWQKAYNLTDSWQMAEILTDICTPPSRPSRWCFLESEMEYYLLYCYVLKA